jgi:hypothetical protein
MQPTQNQVERSLEALRHPPDPSADDAPATDDDAADVAEVSGDQADIHTAVLELLGDEPVIRLDRLSDVRRRLDAGEQPTDDDLAGRMVGRLVCDRLR